MGTILGQGQPPPLHLVSQIDDPMAPKVDTTTTINSRGCYLTSTTNCRSDFISSNDNPLSTLPRTTLTLCGPTRPRPSPWSGHTLTDRPQLRPLTGQSDTTITVNPMVGYPSSSSQCLPVDNYPVASGKTARLNSRQNFDDNSGQGFYQNLAENVYCEITDTGDGSRVLNDDRMGKQFIGSFKNNTRGKLGSAIQNRNMGDYIPLPIVSSPRRVCGEFNANTMSTIVGDSPRRFVDSNTLSTTVGDSPRRSLDSPKLKMSAKNQSSNLRRKHQHLFHDSEDDTASDVHNLTDFSEDEDRVAAVDTTNSDLSGQSSASSKSNHYTSSPKHLPQKRNRKQKLDISSFDFNGSKVTNI